MLEKILYLNKYIGILLVLNYCDLIIIFTFNNQ
ncbi:hypothetical protein GGQ94_002887 [Petrimonas sulfuriphila]